MNNFGHSYDHSTVIDRDGIVQYSKSGVELSNIQSKIDELLATSLEENDLYPKQFELFSNYPNPFNPETTIRFSVDVTQKINLNIFDTQGRLIRKLIDAEIGPGNHSRQWDGRNQNGLPVSSGIYLYQLKGEKNTIFRKMHLLK